MKPKEKHDYPIVLTVKEICEILHIGKRVGYELMDRPGFPTIRIGEKLKRVERDAFFDWIQKEANVVKVPNKRTKGEHHEKLT